MVSLILFYVILLIMANSNGTMMYCLSWLGWPKRGLYSNTGFCQQISMVIIKKTIGSNYHPCVFGNHKHILAEYR